jgi:regulator of protease activity HflC (stomatin/prohibitin superfamily)
MPLWLIALLRSRVLWGVALAAAVLVGGKLYVDGRYDAGVKAGRAECESAAIQAQLDKSERLRKDAERRAELESERADRAYRTAGVREGQARRVEEAAVAQANADEVCIQEETADAIRAIR